MESVSWSPASNKVDAAIEGNLIWRERGEEGVKCSDQVDMNCNANVFIHSTAAHRLAVTPKTLNNERSQTHSECL